MASNPTEMLLDRLDNVKQVRENKWQAKCPAHDDQHPSLSIGAAEDGQVLVKCHAGCDAEDVVSAAGLSMRDLFPVDRCHEQQSTVEKASPDPRNQRVGGRGSISAMYDYEDKSGKFLYQVVRYEPKDFRQRRPDGNGGWIWNMDGVNRVLYRLSDIVSSSPEEWIFITEGEKDADALHGIGLVATTNSGGAGKWGSISDTSVLKDRRVAIIPDCDEPGYKHGQDVARYLQGIAKDVRIIDLRVIKEWEGKDVSDWLDWLECREPEELRDSLVDMAEEAPEFKGADWPEVMPLEYSLGNEIEFPVKALPDWLRAMVQRASISIQTPLGLAGTFALGILSLCSSGKFRVKPRNDWSESLSLFLVAGFPSGARKSPVFDIMFDPLSQWESDRIKKLRSKRAREKEKLTILQKKLVELEKKARSDDGEEAMEKALDLAEKLEHMKLPVLPRLFASDVTQEGAGRLMSEQGGCIGICSPEGAEVLDIMGGRYSGSGKVNLDVYLKGYTGESIRIDRGSRDFDAITVDYPFIPICISVQPCVLEEAWKRQDFFERGLLGRFLCSYPQHRLGYRAVNPPCIPDAIKDTYRKSISSLLDTFHGIGHIDQPYNLKLTPQAEEAFTRVRENNEMQLRPGERYGNNLSWGGKLDGTIMRIAGLLHLAEFPTDPSPWSKPISAKILSSAVLISEYFEGQLSLVQGSCGETPEAKIAHRILSWIKHHERSSFSTRDAYRSLGISVAKAEPALELLESANYIRKAHTDPEKRPGRMDSQEWDVNPKWYSPSVNSVSSVKEIG